MVLEDICEFIVDCPHSTVPDESVGYPLIRTPNVGRGRLILDGVHRVSKETYDKRNARAVPQIDDIIFAREAPAGNAALIREGQEVCLGQRTVLIRPDKNKVCPEFLVYYILAPKQQYELLGTANGATVAHVNLPIIRKMPVNLPDIYVQKKISRYIAKYDDLIENNQKQIKLLEEAAQRLYKEWFVDLRFPGHEECKIVDGVPEGWCAVPIDEAYEIKYGKTLPTSKISESGRYPVYGANGIIGYYSEKNVDEIVPLITSRGNGSGDVLRTYDEEAFITNNSFIVKGKYNYLTMPFSYEHMLCLKFKSICTGSAQPQLTNNSISTMTVIIPSENNIEKYNIIVSKWFEMIDNLKEQNKKLSESRDRLLPKLMSGEIEV